ncbi:STAS domain-containing protein [Thiomicrospira sp. R3]|uniref:STAS domain-containing protein n=1 Tax=Thiomicrospira sp. R3 TaxID=3035472 RepID=UPI00259BD3FD|nr:STAS domain-containing protein [Thiomicrospira sp. R3]WFE68836.1 STAS domain-containing protein [Thiomicrospira sp. R3]
MSNVIALPENLTIHYAASYLEKIKAQLETSDGVVFESDKVETLDTSGVQLLLVVINDLTARGIEYCFESPSKVLVEAIQALGLSPHFKLN